MLKQSRVLLRLNEQSNEDARTRSLGVAHVDDVRIESANEAGVELMLQATACFQETGSDLSVYPVSLYKRAHLILGDGRQTRHSHAA